MFWFDVIFWPIMIVAPAVWLGMVTTPPGVEVDRSEIRRLTAWTWFWTALAGITFVVLWFAWPGFPRPMILGLIAPAFSLALRTIPLKNPDWGGGVLGGKTRTASLVNRSATTAIASRSWMLAWAIPVGTIVAVVARRARPLETAPDHNEPVLWGIALGLAVLALLNVPAAMWAVRRTRDEPEPRDALGDPAIADEYARLRDFRAWCFYGLFGIAMPALFCGMAILLAWMPRGAGGPWLGWVGGLLGCAVGLSGAIFGTVAGLRRVRINRRLRHLHQGSPN
jgi:hypothetical protein